MRATSGLLSRSADRYFGGGMPAPEPRPTAPPHSGTRAFYRAVLEQALDDWARLRDATNPRAMLQREALRAWFASSERRWPCAFEALCDTLDLDPDYLRRRLPDAEYRPGVRGVLARSLQALATLGGEATVEDIAAGARCTVLQVQSALSQDVVRTATARVVRVGRSRFRLRGVTRA